MNSKLEIKYIEIKANNEIYEKIMDKNTSYMEEA
jgi:hypothetical protein